MVNRGMVGTSFINTSTTGTPEKLTWEQIKIMLSNGWDVQCHLHNHINLANATEQQIIDNLENINAEFIAQSLEPPKHIAYPYGAISGGALNVIAQYRQSGRIVTNKAILPYYTDKYALNCYASGPRTTEDIEDMEQGILSAIEAGREIIFLLHRIKESAVQYETEPSRFLELLDIIEYYNLETITISELYNRL